MKTKIPLAALTAALTVPEPSSVALLGLGGLALILRRRK
ncbi:MAG: PEP-CTERM sorting domain-containing protein [Akkermansiaceae bacterium]